MIARIITAVIAVVLTVIASGNSAAASTQFIPAKPNYEPTIHIENDWSQYVVAYEEKKTEEQSEVYEEACDLFDLYYANLKYMRKNGRETLRRTTDNGRFIYNRKVK